MPLKLNPIRIVSFLALLFLGSCANDLPLPDQAAAELQGNTLADADRLITRSQRIDGDEQATAVYQLRAAEIAWSQLDTDGGVITDVSKLSESGKHALRIIDKATEGVASSFIGDEKEPRKTFSYGGFSYRVEASGGELGNFPLAALESAKPAHKVKRTLTENWHAEDGVGVAYAPKWKRPEDPKLRRFVSSLAYPEPITAVMTFDKSRDKQGARDVIINGYDPTYLTTVKLGETEYPLEADFTAPIVEQTSDINELVIALTGLIHPGVLDSEIIMLEPYNKDRIPVLMVHGLKSHPRMWRDVFNDLRADPELRGKYQFMLFYYPTAWPITYSSMRLREELDAFQATFGPTKEMVMIGHSMGGLLSRMQVVNPGRQIWDDKFGDDADRLYAKLPADHLLKRGALFSADEDIGRQVYICTPHRGSGLADLSLTSWFIKLVKLPSTITSAFIDLPGNLIERGQITSVAELSPSNTLYKSLDGIPIEVPHHSIIGDRGKGNTPESSDGVVPYWSSHLDGAESEVIVPDNHGAFDDPQAIAELRRILLLHAAAGD